MKSRRPYQLYETRFDARDPNAPRTGFGYRFSNDEVHYTIRCVNEKYKKKSVKIVKFTEPVYVRMIDGFFFFCVPAQHTKRAA